MKKRLTVLLVLASLTMAGVAAAMEPASPDAAAPPTQTMMDCPRIAAQADPEMQEKIQKFYKDTDRLRKQIAMKRAELEAIINAAQPDPATAGKMAGELYDLQASLRIQAQAAGLGQFGPGCGMGMGGGFGRSFSRGSGRW